MADILSVSNAQELRSALNGAKGGETIELAGGDYGELNLLTFKSYGVKAIYDSPVTITSADPEDRASFSGMDLREVKNLTFDNVVFDSKYTGSKTWVSEFRVDKSEGITIRDSLFQGKTSSDASDPIAYGFGTGKGLTVTGSSDVVIENNEFTTWHRALVVGGSDDVRVTGNDVHSIRSDGMNFAHVQGVLIEDNYIHDFARSKESGDHPDMIQFWTNGGSRPSTDVIIRGNTLDVGDGDTTQSIFMRNDRVDRGFAGEEMFYQNLLIEENVILNNHAHGILVGETNGLVIRKNSVLDGNAANFSSVATPKINVSSQSKNVVIEQNATAAVSGHSGQPDWTVSDNARVQNTDPNASGYYATEFVTSSIDGDADGYVANPNGTIAQLDAGASRLQLDTSPDSLRTGFDVATDAGISLVFDAAHTYGAAGKVTGSDAQFIWDFGDGTGATGQLVRHTYAEAGRYDATLTVVTPDGAMATAKSAISMMGADVLSFDPQTGFLQTEKYGEDTAVTDSDRGSIMTDDGYGIDLGAPGVATSASKSQIARLFGAESFDMSMTLRADTLGSTGLVAQAASNFMLSIVDRGEVSFRLWTDEGHAKLTTTRITVNDGEDHDIRIAFDSAASRLEIHVDGVLAAATEIEGAVRGDFPRALHFGHAWGKQNFDGTLTAFDLDVGNRDYPNYVGDASVIPGDAVPLDALPRIEQDAADPVQEEPPQTTAPDEQETQEDSGAPEEVPTSEDHTEAPVDDTPLPPDETETQDPTVVVDVEGDRIKVILDDDTTPDTTDPDPVPVSSDPVGYVRGGEISTAWARHFHSDINDTNDTDDSEVFVDDAVALT
jgi:hypothetical protein